MSLIGAVHTALAVAALVTGAAVLLRRKGGPWHRRLGWTYVISMLGLNLTALAIYRLFGGFGPFHIAALASLVTVVLGALPARRRLPRGKWIEHHYYWMTWSYVGLLAAAGSEAVTRIPQTRFWWMVLAATLPVVGGGAWLIRRQSTRTLRRHSALLSAPATAGD